MAIYRNIQLSFWTDNKVEDDFTPEDKFFYLYLLTNPQTNICGCYEVSYSQMSNNTGYNKDTINRLIERFEKVHKVIRFNRETKEILILNWAKYNWNSSANTLKGVENVSKYIKCEEFRNYVIEMLNCVRNGIEKKPVLGDVESADAVNTDTETIVIEDNNGNTIEIKDLNELNKVDLVVKEENEIEELVEEDKNFNYQSAWNYTLGHYPKHVENITARRIWANKLCSKPINERGKLAIDIYVAVDLYRTKYLVDNPDDTAFKFAPKLGKWLVEDCDYWLEKVKDVKINKKGQEKEENGEKNDGCRT